MANITLDVYTDLANNNINRGLLIFASSLSTIGSLITIFTYFAIRDIKTMSRHIIVCISLADLFTCLSNLSGILMGPTKHNYSTIMCEVQSFFSTTAILASFLWTLMLAVYLYLAIVKEKQDTAKIIIFPWSHLFCWSVPVVINIVAITTGNLGNGGDRTSAGWCWIKTVDSNGKARDHGTILFWMLFDGKGLEMITYAAILVLCIKIKLHLRFKIRNYSRSDSQRSDSPYGTFLTRKTMVAAKQADRKLIFIPVILIFLRIWGTVRFFIYVAETGDSYYHRHPSLYEALLYLHTLGDNLQGAMNCILFCFFTPKVWNHIIQRSGMCCQRFVSCCYCRSCCGRSRKSYGESTDEFSDDSDD